MNNSLLPDTADELDIFLTESGIEVSQSLLLCMKLCMSITQLLDMSASDPATAHSRESALLHVLRKHDISFARAGEEFRLNFGNPQSYIVTQVFQMLQHDGGTIFDLPTSAITEYLDGLFSYVYEGNTERVMYLRRCSEIYVTSSGSNSALKCLWFTGAHTFL
mgnify:CR=1 FL=1